MKFLVIGTGSIGKRHIRNLIGLGHKVIGFDTSKESIKAASEEFNIKVFDGIDVCLADVPAIEAAFICTPADTHIEYAVICAKHKMDIFIEKPLAAGLDGTGELIEIIDKNNLVSMVGCNMRFDVGLAKLKTLLEKKTIGDIYSVNVEFGYDLRAWRKGVDYRKNYAAKKEQGGGVVFDCIHELDYICWMLDAFPEQYTVQGGHLSDLEIETEDIALVQCKFSNGVLGSIHLDYLQPSYCRTCKVLGSMGSLFWSLTPEKVSLKLINAQQEVNYFNEYDSFNINNMYVKGLEHFLECIKSRRQTVNTVADAVKILDWAKNIRDKL